MPKLDKYGEDTKCKYVKREGNFLFGLMSGDLHREHLIWVIYDWVWVDMTYPSHTVLGIGYMRSIWEHELNGTRGHDLLSRGYYWDRLGSRPWNSWILGVPRGPREQVGQCPSRISQPGSVGRVGCGPE